MATIVEFVRNYVNENGRGCPKNVVIYVGGFKAKDIVAALEANVLETSRGSEGGLFPAGEKPAPKGDNNPTLKARMVDFLRTLDDDTAKALVSEYDAEIEKRRQAQN
jgi:hypothetical protein